MCLSVFHNVRFFLQFFCKWKPERLWQTSVGTPAGRGHFNTVILSSRLRVEGPHLAIKYINEKRICGGLDSRTRINESDSLIISFGTLLACRVTHSLRPFVRSLMYRLVGWWDSFRGGAKNQTLNCFDGEKNVPFLMCRCSCERRSAIGR